ncbi:MAG: hypothetical protein GWP09_02830 [Nitrospiraceae bacterium]|nr:hypothetical protein [Nitrospiraceae bacterium]
MSDIKRKIEFKNGKYLVETINIFEKQELMTELENILMTITANKGRVENLERQIVNKQELIDNVRQTISDFNDLARLISDKLSEKDKQAVFDKVHKREEEIKKVREAQKQALSPK